MQTQDTNVLRTNIKAWEKYVYELLEAEHQANCPKHFYHFHSNKLNFINFLKNSKIISEEHVFSEQGKPMQAAAIRGVKSNGNMLIQFVDDNRILEVSNYKVCFGLKQSQQE